MLKTLGLLFLSSCATSALVAPMDPRLEDIQCRCLSFTTSAKPTLCTYLESHSLDWHTAYSLAADYDLKIQFASEATITKVLSISKPLPSSVLESISNGEVLPIESTDLIQSENKIVCGLGEEVQHMGTYDSSSGPECHHVGAIVGGLMMVVIIYLIGQHAWARSVSSPHPSTDSLN